MPRRYRTRLPRPSVGIVYAYTHVTTLMAAIARARPVSEAAGSRPDTIELIRTVRPARWYRWVRDRDGYGHSPRESDCRYIWLVDRDRVRVYDALRLEVEPVAECQQSEPCDCDSCSEEAPPSEPDTERDLSRYLRDPLGEDD